MSGWVMPCEVYSRVVGYMRPVQTWNVGKQQEFKDRNHYDVNKIRKNVNITEGLEGNNA